MSAGNGQTDADKAWEELTQDDPPDLKYARRQTKVTSAVSVDRPPPHSPECEMGILGCVLISPKECMAEVISRFKAGGVEFYDLRHQTIWNAMVEMYDVGTAIDVITLQQELKNKEMLEQVGGIIYISSLQDSVPSSANLKYYLDFVMEKYHLRRTIQVCTEAVGRVYDYEGEVDQLLDEVSRDIMKVTESREQVGMKGIKDLVASGMTAIENFSQSQGALTGVATGYSDLDKMTKGLQPGEMIVIAARPSMGKTSLAMNIAENVALDQKLPVGVFSLEMTGEALVFRMICSRARVNVRNVTDGFLAERDYPKITNAAGKIAGAPLYIDDTAALSLLQLRAKSRRMVEMYGIKLIVIDYLQLLHIQGRRESRQQEVADISKGIKALAKELGIPIIVLSQLNRDIEHDGKRKPRLSDIRESGAVEQDADLVAFLYKPQITDDESPDYYADAIAVNLLVAKQRNGPTGDVKLTFLKGITRFESAALVSDEDVPEAPRLFSD